MENDDAFEQTVHGIYTNHTSLFVDQPIDEVKSRVDIIRNILENFPPPSKGDLLFIREDKEQGRWMELKDSVVSIGSGEDNDVHLDSNYVSTIHCNIKVTDEGWWLVEDLDSSNGVFVNNRKVKNYVLIYGDIIQIADVLLIFFGNNSLDSEEL